METISRKDMLTELLELYRLQRHDFLNHFQVAMGYLQLGKHQVALDYLRRAAAENSAISVFSRLKPPELAVQLMVFAATCFRYGVELCFDVDDELPEIEWDLSHNKALGFIRELIPGSSCIDLDLFPGRQGIRLVTTFTGLNADLWQKSRAVIKALEIPFVQVQGEDYLEIEFQLGLSG